MKSSVNKWYSVNFIIKKIRWGFSAENPISTWLWVLLGAIILIPLVSLSLRIYDKEGIENILIEAHGMLFDIIVLGIIFGIVNRKTRRIQDIKRYKEELDDYRGWDDKEARFRIVGIIKRLAKVNVKKIDLIKCYLEGAEFTYLKLHKSDLSEANLSNTYFWYADFTKSRFILTNFHKTHINESLFCEANLHCVDFTEAVLLNTNFMKANLVDVNFTNANLNNADFAEANCTKANFTGARYLSYEQLSLAKCLYECKGIPIKIEKKLRETHLHLFDKLII